MSKQTFHPPAERLEAYVEDTLGRPERGAVELHLLECTHCQKDVTDLRGLFSALARLQHFSPVPGFMSRVMAHVKLPEPWWARAHRFVRPFVPHTSRGWAFASAFFALPLMGASAVMLWLLSKPYVTGENVVAFALQQAGGRISAIFDSAVSAAIQSNLTFLLARGLEAFTSSGVRGAGAMAALFATVTVLSAWVLYQNLFRSTTRRSDYASYSF